MSGRTDKRRDAERIARELEMLGEPALERDELDSASRWPLDREVADVTALFAGAWPETAVEVGDEPELTAMERHRAWKRVAGGVHALERVATVHEVATAGRGPWRIVAAGLAAAAAIALFPRLVADPGPPQDERSVAATRGLAVQARRALDELPGERDGARARAVADAYAQRMRSAKEAG